MARSLQALAAEFARELPPGGAPEVRIAAVANELRAERPDTTARGRQTAAARALGLPPPPSDAEMQSEIDAAYEASTVRGRARRARAGASQAAGAVKAASAPVRSLPSPFRSAGSVRGLVFQALALSALYWVLRTPAAVGRVTSGAARSFRWLTDVRGIGGAPQ